jgi:hypothetical protein
MENYESEIIKLEWKNVKLDEPATTVISNKRSLEEGDEPMDFNAYATSKSYSQSHLNLSTIGLQISVLVDVFSSGNLNGYKIALIVLTLLALLLQFLIFALLAVLAAAKTNSISKHVGKHNCSCTAVGINSAVTTMTGLLLITTLATTTINSYGKFSVPMSTVVVVNSTT